MRIAIDLTPILPGGHNGGAKIMTLQLVKHLAELAPTYTFLLLTSEKNYRELSVMQAHNVQIINTSLVQSLSLSKTLFRLFCAFSRLAIAKIKRLMPAFIKKLVNSARNYSSFKLVKLAPFKLVNADLLFCPFTAPFFRHLNIPIVSVIYDLQSHYYPSFFTSNERHERKRHFDDACEASNKLVCISHFVRQTVLENSKMHPEDVKTIHIRLANRLFSVGQYKIESTLRRYKLTNNNFLLFPANFWAHKNHQILLVAFSIFLANNPQSNLQLVCTGADNQYKELLFNSIQKMGLGSSVILPGYLSDEEFASLVTGCKAVIFPSLYEGFGMPILEAMSAGKPVLCSNLTSLPEVAGEAALLFDPKKPHEIAHAIERIECDPSFVSHLIELGYKQIAGFGTDVNMAEEYLSVFQDVMKSIKS